MAKTKKKAVPDAQRCKKIQQKGTRCKLRRSKGSKFCFNHKGSRSSNPGGRSVAKAKGKAKKTRTVYRKAKKKSGGKPKLPSLSKSVAVVGGVIVITGLGADQAANLVGAIDAITPASVAVGPATIVSVVFGLKIAAHFSPWFGNKYRSLLKSWGFRP